MIFELKQVMDKYLIVITEHVSSMAYSRNRSSLVFWVDGQIFEKIPYFLV